MNTMNGNPDNPSNPQLGSIQYHLKRFGRRLRLSDAWRLTQHSLWLGILAALLVQAAGRLWPIANLGLWTLAPLLTWLLLVASISLLRPMPLMHTARRVDSQLGLKERLSTALALQEMPNAFPKELTRAQQRDALSASAVINIGKAFPLRLNTRDLLAACALAAGVLLLVFLPNPMDAVLAQREAIAQAAQQQAEKIEDLSQEIQSAEELSPEERDELLRQLAELAKALRDNPGDLEQALADLSRVEEAFRQKLDPNSGLRQANLEALAAQMASLAGEETSLGEASIEEAAEALQSLAEQLDQMDAEQRQSLAESLAQMAAQAAQAGNADLAQALSALSQAAQSGDQAAASQAAQQASQAMDSTQHDLAAQEALQQALGQLDSSRQALAQAGGTPQSAQGPGGSQAPGQAPGGESQGQNPGQGPGQSQGQPGGGGGTKADTLPPGVSQGSADRPQGAGQSAPQGDPDSQVYVPWERRPGEGEESFIPGQDTGQGETQVSEGGEQLPGASGPALVPYSDVYYSYLNAANQTIQQSYIPAALKDYVREYFSNLEP